jgi:hypothetical protein
VRLTASKAELHRQTIAVDNGMDLAGQPATRATNMLAAVIGDTGSMLVHADDRRIDHLHRRIMSGGQRIHDPVPDTSPPPANEAVVAGRVGGHTAPANHAKVHQIAKSTEYRLWPAGRRHAECPAACSAGSAEWYSIHCR